MFIFNQFCPIQEKKNLTESIRLRKRKPIQNIDKSFSYSGLKEEASNSSEEYYSHCKSKKSKGKRSKKQ